MKRIKTVKPWAMAILGMAVVLFVAPRVEACATCFGQTDSPLGRGLNWGIFALLLVVTMVLAGISSFFVFIVRRTARIEREDAQGEASTGVEGGQELKASKNQES